jgi:hypothetical protein
MQHAFGWDPLIIAVPPRGNPAGRKLGRGAYACTQCRVLLGFAVRFGDPAMGDCPGVIRPAPPYAYAGSDLNAKPYWRDAIADRSEDDA